MTPKEQYEARKEARARNKREGRKTDTDIEMIDMFDRFVTAIERISETYGRTGGR